jgi:hypothetical protein
MCKPPVQLLGSLVASTGLHLSVCLWMVIVAACLAPLTWLGTPKGGYLLDNKQDANPGLWIRIWICINLSCWIRIRIQEGKKDPQI